MSGRRSASNSACGGRAEQLSTLEVELDIRVLSAACPAFCVTVHASCAARHTRKGRKVRLSLQPGRVRIIVTHIVNTVARRTDRR